MVKLISIVFVIYLIEALLQTCIASPAAVMAGIGLVSSVISLGQWLYDTTSAIFSTERSKDQSLQLIRHFTTAQRTNAEDIMIILKDQPRTLYSEIMNTNLAIEVDQINIAFERAVQYKREIMDGYIESPVIYTEFFKVAQDTDVSMSKIRTIILTNSIFNNLRMNLTTDIEVYERFCKTGISHFQLIDKLLATLRTVSGQYYTIKILAYNFLDLRSGPVHANETVRFTRQFNENLQEVMDTIKPYMANASREIWTCDLSNYADDVRYANNSDSGYAELVIFQKYFAIDGSFQRWDPTRESCTRPEKYMSSTRRAPFDRSIGGGVHACTHAVDCKPFFSYHPFIRVSVTHYICFNTNNTARYQSLVPKAEEDKLICKDGTKLAIRPTTISASYRDLCNCTCIKNFIYLSITPVHASSNNVVTGIKFTMLDNILYPQIQEGRLLPNGIVNESTLAWKKVQHIGRVNSQAKYIILDTILLLSDVKLSKDRVVTGLQFEQWPYNREDPAVILSVYSKEINFQSGIFSRESEVEKQKTLLHLEKLDLSNRDVPTRSRRPNKLDSSSIHFLSFKMSSLELDGGQTTIPFIDTQEVKTNPPSPLAGIGLFHRGQPGYGGFLSFKVITFDTNPYVADDSNLNDTFLNL